MAGPNQVSSSNAATGIPSVPLFGSKDDTASSPPKRFAQAASQAGGKGGVLSDLLSNIPGPFGFIGSFVAKIFGS
jgi:hypothetical protein